MRRVNLISFASGLLLALSLDPAVAIEPELNRLYLGGGRKTGAPSKLQLGVIWQHRPNADLFRLVVGYNHNFDLREDDL
jgi:hypothetical protein